MPREDKLLAEYVRMRRTPSRIYFEVKVVNRKNADAYFERWSLASALRLSATPLDIDRARMMLLSDYRHFRVCETCGERRPRGLFGEGPEAADVCEDCQEG